MTDVLVGWGGLVVLALAIVATLALELLHEIADLPAGMRSARRPLQVAVGVLVALVLLSTALRLLTLS